MGTIWRDVKYGLGTLFKRPGFSAVVVLTHALGIGVATAVFSIFHGVLLAPLPYPEPHEIVRVYDTQPACATCPASFPKYHDWKERNRVFAAIGGSTSVSRTLTGEGEPLRVRGARTTASLVDVFAVYPRIGRWYTEEEDRPGGPAVVVISHSLWVERFAADPAILGRTMILEGRPHEVIGVMPEGFAHRRADFYVPLQLELNPATRGRHFLATYARLKKDVSLERATAEMRALGDELAREFSTNHGIDVQSYTEAVVGDVRTPLNVLLGAVFLLLLIGSANVANLLLASAVSRRSEMAIRMALGAGRWDIVRQLTAESLVLAVAGGAAGILLAQWAVTGFVALAENQLPRAATIAVDGTVLAFAAVVSAGVGIFCGLWPVFLLRKQDLAQVVREGDLRTGTGAGKRTRSGLVVAEIAVAFALLVSAGLLVKNFVLLRSRDAGLRTDRIVAFLVALSGERSGSPEAVVTFYRELQSRLAQVGTVESVGMTSHLPMYSYGYNGYFNIEGELPWPPEEAPLVEYRWFYGDYFQTLGVPLLQGRLPDARDGPGTRTVLINRGMAEKFWPGRDPIGRRFGQGADTSQWYEVVGVIGDVRSYGLARNTPYEFYRNIQQSAHSGMTVVVRTRGADPTSIIPTARQIVASLDPALPISQVQTMEEVVADSVGQPRLVSALTASFAALGGLLAMVGVYGVMAYNVRKQRREFGIRLAIGATPYDLQRLVLRRGLTLAVLGIAIGGLGAWLLTGILRAMLHDVQPTDATVFAGTATVMVLVALLASYVPARAAGRVDPVVALRYE